MKRTMLAVLALAMAAGLTACASVHAKDQSQGIRALMRRATEARQAGRLAETVRLYEEAVAASLPTDGRRPEALYWAGMLRLSPDPELRDLATARRALEELTRGWPSFGRRQEAELGLALAGDIASCEADAESARSEAAQAGAAWAGEKTDLTARLEAALASASAARSELETAQAEAKAARAEAQRLRAENKSKDEALRKVREVLKDWKPKR